MKKFVMRTVLHLGMQVSLSLTACNMSGKSDVELVKKSYLRMNLSKTVGQAFDGYKYFKTRKWEAYKEHANHFVKFTAEMDIADRLTKEYYDRMNKRGTRYHC